MSANASAKSSSPKQEQELKQVHADDTCDSDLSRMGRLVWTGLCKNLTRPSKNNPKAVYTGLAWPKLDTLMQYTSSSERSVRRGLRELEAKGWITCVGYADKGRGHSRKYLLHKPGPRLIQPAKNDRANSPSEWDILPVRAAKLPVQPAKNDRAYKEDILLRKTLKNTSSSLEKTLEPATKTADDGDESLSISSEKAKPEDNEIFRQIERQISSGLSRVKLDGVARQSIRAALKQQGYTLKHLAVFLENTSNFESSKINNRAGLLIRYAQNFRQRADGFQFPECLNCRDTGKVKFEGSPFAEKGPCDCPAGVTKAKTNFPQWEAWKAAEAAGEPFCANCNNTGEKSSGAPCSDCAHGREKMEKYRKAAEEQKREQAEYRAEQAKQKKERAEQELREAKQAWASGDLKLACRIALKAAGLQYSVNAIDKVEEVRLDGDALRVRASKFARLVLMDAKVEQIVSALVGKTVHVRFEEKV